MESGQKLFERSSMNYSNKQ